MKEYVSSIEIVDIIDTSKFFAELSRIHIVAEFVCLLGAVREFTDNEEVVALEFETALQLWHCEMRKIARWARLENGS
jgi:molybdopterin synthase catalytic subunit